MSTQDHAQARIQLCALLNKFSASTNEYHAYIQEAMPQGVAIAVANAIEASNKARMPDKVHPLGTPVVVHTAGARLQIGKVVSVRTTLGVPVGAGGNVAYGNPQTGVSYQVYCEGDIVPHGGLSWHDAGSVFTSVADLAFMKPFLAGAVQP